MRRGILILSGSVLLLLYFSSCNFSPPLNNRVIPSDSATIAKGKTIFTENCIGCHNFTRGGIGPQLDGLTDSVSADWIRHFVRDPQKIIESGDERAQRLFKKYKVAMPSFNVLKNDELNGIIAYMNTYKKPVQQTANGDGNEISEPVTDPIQFSSLVVGLELVAQIPPSSVNGKMPLTRITKLDYQPNTGDLFVADLRGKLYKLQNNKPEVYMDITKLRPEFIHEAGLGTGLGSFAFHPNFAKNGLLYTTHAEVPGSGKADFDYSDSINVTFQWVLTEWKVENPGAVVFSGTSRELLRVNMMTVMHGIQEIAFNPLVKPGSEDYGLLYVCVGDGGCIYDGHAFLTHNIEKIWGTVLCIDPLGKNSINGRYGIPQNNPFVKNRNPKALGEMYAYGFKNPHRITWCRSGQMLVSNIGESNIESLNIVMPGHDYGWPTREGTFALDPYGDVSKVYPLPANDSIYKITYPVAQYDHDWGWAAISGGFEYLGELVPQLKGKFIFGDIPSGRLFYVNTADIKQGSLAPIKEWRFSINGVLRTFKELLGSDNRLDMHFGRDARGELYILIKQDGKIYKLVSATTNS